MRDKVKALWIKGMKAVSNAAASIASNTRYKVDEVTIQNRRREVLNDLAHKAYALWLKGETFPEPMDKMLNELKQLDEQLNDMRAEKYASSVIPQDAETPDGEPEQAGEEEEEEETDPLTNPDDSPVRAEINDLFDSTPSVDKSAEKVNSTLDQMSDRIRNFPRGNSDDRQEGQD